MNATNNTAHTHTHTYTITQACACKSNIHAGDCQRTMTKQLEANKVQNSRLWQGWETYKYVLCMFACVYVCKFIA